MFFIIVCVICSLLLLLTGLMLSRGKCLRLVAGNTFKSDEELHNENAAETAKLVSGTCYAAAIFMASFLLPYILGIVAPRYAGLGWFLVIIFFILMILKTVHTILKSNH